MPSVGCQTLLSALTVIIGEQAGIPLLEHVCFDGEVQPVVGPQGGEPVRRRVAPEQLPRRSESALFAEHLQEARGVVAELALSSLVDGHHGPMKLPLGLDQLCLPGCPAWCLLVGTYESPPDRNNGYQRLIPHLGGASRRSRLKGGTAQPAGSA